MLELNIMGWPQMRLEGKPLAVRPRRLLFFSYLALEGPLDRGRLASCFWDGLDPEVARSRLRLELHRIAISVPGRFLRVSGETVGVQVQCDARDLANAFHAGDWAEAARLYRGTLLAKQAADRPALQAWLETTRAQYAEQARVALEHLVAEADQRSDPLSALAAEEQLLELDPYSEARCAKVLARLRDLGRHRDASALEAQFKVRYWADVGPRSIAERQPRAAHTTPERPSLRNPPFVGREVICTQLDTWMAQPSQMALLTGEGGVGKTRLAEEWLSQRGARMLVLRASQLAQSVPFSAVGELLHQIGEARLRALSPVWRSELSSLWPELVPDQRVKRSSSQPRLLEAISEAMRLGADGAVLVLDDLHWFDPSSVQAVSHALRRWQMKGQAPRVLATARPGDLVEHGAALAWIQDLERAGNLSRLEVSPLGEVAVLKLIRQLSGSQQATGLARRLHSLSGGNPYALLAFLQGLEEQGVLRTADQGWHLAVDLHRLDQHLAPSLRDRLCQMVRQAGRPLLRWMETAALLTAPFDFEAAMQGACLSEDQALSALDQALTHRWVVAAGPSGYRLSHDLLRHALQAQLSPARARVVHRRLAAHLDRPGSDPGQVAHHLECAGAHHQAYPFWMAAASNAAALWAHSEALEMLTHALACQNDPQEQAALRLQRCTHLKALNDLAAWGEELDRLEILLGEMKTSDVRDAHELAYIRQRTHLLWRTGEFTQALAFSQPWTHGTASEERVALLHDRAMLLYQVDRTQEAVELLNMALGQLGPGSQRIAANLHNALTLCALDLEQNERGLDHALQAVQLFDELDLKDGLASAHGNQALAFAALGDRTAQRQSLERAFRYATESQNVFLERQCLEALCDVMAEDNDWAAGLALATHGLELCESALDERGSDQFQLWIQTFKNLRTKALLLTT